MRYSSQALFGFMAIFSIMTVQNIDMAHGSRHSYVQATNDIGTDDGVIFDTRSVADSDVSSTSYSNRLTNAG
ncbi:hypothetical protein [Brucella pseudogrignonensis]